MVKTRMLLVVSALFSFVLSDFIVADEFPRGPGPVMLARMAAKRIKKMREKDNFSGADQNKDGHLDKQEIESAKKTHGNFIDDETFKKIDTNGDGKLSHEECEKFQKEMEKEEAAGKPSEKTEEKTVKDTKN